MEVQLVKCPLSHCGKYLVTVCLSDRVVTVLSRRERPERTQHSRSGGEREPASTDGRCHRHHRHEEQSPHLSTTVSTFSTPLYYSLHSLHILHTDCLLCAWDYITSFCFQSSNMINLFPYFNLFHTYGVSWNVHPSGSAFHETWRAENWTALFHMIFLELYNILFNILLQINILSSTTFCSELIRKYTNLFIANLLWWSFLQIILNFQVIQCWSNKRYLERL